MSGFAMNSDLGFYSAPLVSRYGATHFSLLAQERKRATGELSHVAPQHETKGMIESGRFQTSADLAARSQRDHHTHE